MSSIADYLCLFGFIILVVLILLWAFKPGQFLKASIKKGEKLGLGQKHSQISNDDYKGMSTSELLEALLRKFQCQVERDEDGNYIAKYQGETFLICIMGDMPMLNIWDYRWLEFSLDNLEEVACVQRAINTSNQRDFCTAVYVIDTDENVLTVNSNRTCILTPDVPHVEELFQSLLDSFFVQHHGLVIDFNKEKVKMGLKVT